MIDFISDISHYDIVLNLAIRAKRSLWIGTADIKDLYVVQGQVEKPFLELLSDLIGKGVEVRLIHAKEPGPNFRKDFDLYPSLWNGMERALCPRVHFKMLIFDMEAVYIGSANLTGAAFGMKSERNRNFEAGFFIDEMELVNEAVQQFDEVWMGMYCKKCGRKDVCKDRIV